MSKYRIIIFDFDGVLLESAEIKTDAYKQLFLKHGKSEAKKAKLFFKENPGMFREEKIRQCYQLILNKKISKEILEQELSTYQTES